MAIAETKRRLRSHSPNQPGKCGAIHIPAMERVHKNNIVSASWQYNDAGVPEEIPKLRSGREFARGTL